MDRALSPVLRITWPRPGFFLNDCRFVILLDRYVVYDGSFLSGMDMTFPVQSGWHTVDTQIHLGPITRSKNYSVEVPPGRGVTLLLEYSRLWGNFVSKPKIFAF